MGRLSIKAEGLWSAARAMSGITLRSTVADGPSGTKHRDVSVLIPESSLGFLLSSVATDPRYAPMFRAIADEQDRRAAIVADPNAGACEAMANKPDSVQTGSALARVATAAIRPRYAVRRRPISRAYGVYDTVTSSFVSGALERAEAESLADTMNNTR